MLNTRIFHQPVILENGAESSGRSRRQSYLSIVGSVDIEWQGSPQQLPTPFFENFFFIISQPPIVRHDEMKFKTSRQDLNPANRENPAKMINQTMRFRS